jgi:hypothetical protein
MCAASVGTRVGALVYKYSEGFVLQVRRYPRVLPKTEDVPERMLLKTTKRCHVTAVEQQVTRPD